MPNPAHARVVGIDPGATHSGIVARNGRLVDAATLSRRPGEGVQAYAGRVAAQVEAFAAALGEGAMVAVEGAKIGRLPPKMRGVVTEARQVLEALLLRLPDARLIAPDGHDRQPPSAYPAGLRGRRPTRFAPNEHARGDRRHERAAWMVTERALHLRAAGENSPADGGLPQPGRARSSPRVRLDAVVRSAASDFQGELAADVEPSESSSDIEPPKVPRAPLRLVPPPAPIQRGDRQANNVRTAHINPGTSEAALERADRLRHLDAFPVDPSREPVLEVDFEEPANQINLTTLDVAEDGRRALVDLFEAMEITAARAREADRAAWAEHKRRVVERLAAYLAAGGDYRAEGGQLIVREVDLRSHGKPWWQQRLVTGPDRSPDRFTVRWSSEHGVFGAETRVHVGEVIIERHRTRTLRWLAGATGAGAGALAGAGAVVWLVVVPWLVHAWPTLVGGIVLAGAGLSALTRGEH